MCSCISCLFKINKEIIISPHFVLLANNKESFLFSQQKNYITSSLSFCHILMVSERKSGNKGNASLEGEI